MFSFDFEFKSQTLWEVGSSMRSQVFFWLVLLSMIFGFSDIVSAQKVSVEEFTLPNGMQFLLVPRTDQPNVVSAGWVARVGSVNERQGITGISHFFEHMMFQGSKNVADEEHFKIISESGGTNNAYTSFDKTVYHQTAPSNMTETLLWLEAD